ncbi:NAD(P)/FAD-dependent oxidoreductase [Streptomyces griseus]|uniref:NAD(P)/FAD-dependent oxidoreductase n=1 Tax=Streptomyces griseus TaxID=1911 RepID=UPI0008402E00|nr:FAD/NAD(P)-binding oxidoreductase [Streptomyces griseus]
MSAGRVVIVGASLGGSRVAEGLRQAGHTGPVVLVDPDPDAPYDRPPLSKQILTGEWTPDRASLGDPAQWQAERHVAAATSLDPANRVLRLDDGTELTYDKLVLACGAVPRTLPGMPRRGVHPLRTLADSLELRARLDGLSGSGHVVVVGGGFVGAEVASAARSRGIGVTMVEALPAPLSGLLGEEVAAELARLHTDNGVRLLCGTSVAALTGAPEVTGVELTDGTVLKADAVVVGVGVRPATDWLAGSGIPLDDGGGILSDEFCAVDAGRTVYAVGDAARCRDPRLGRHLRVEHWTNTVEQAAVVVRNLLEPVPVACGHEFFVWSDQYGGKIALLGRPDPGAEVTVVHADGPRRRFAVAYHHGPRLYAALTVNWPKALLAARRSAGTPDGAHDTVAAWKSL